MDRLSANITREPVSKISVRATTGWGAITVFVKQTVRSCRQVTAQCSSGRDAIALAVFISLRNHDEQKIDLRRSKGGTAKLVKPGVETKIGRAHV